MPEPKEDRPLDNEIVYGIIKLVTSIDSRLEQIERLLRGDDEEEEADS
ncbi:MAG TPA: hypothetical protein VE289_07880 [Gaiellaceae bacterium]|nr:hypothetical protein [Gaiellaceae bacterium]